MRVIAKRTLREFWELNPDSEQQLLAWYREASRADWNNPNEIKQQYAKASILKNNRVVFDILGNKYRLVVEINYKRKWVFIRFIGTHSQYDKINAIQFNMKMKAIKTEQDYRQALKRLEDIFHAEEGTQEGDEAEVLSILIEKYEDEHYPIGMPDPIEAIKFRMEQMGMKQKDLKDIIGYNSRSSEILNRKRKLSLRMIRQLHDKLNISTEVLVQEY